MIEGIRGSAAYRGGTSGDNGGILWVRNPVGLVCYYWGSPHCIVAGQTVLLEVTLYCHTLQLRICADGWNNKGNSQLRGANGIKKLQRVNNMVTH